MQSLLYSDQSISSALPFVAPSSIHSFSVVLTGNPAHHIAVPPWRIEIPDIRSEQLYKLIIAFPSRI